METPLIGAKVTLVGMNNEEWADNEQHKSWAGLEATIVYITPNITDGTPWFTLCNQEGQLLNAGSNFFTVDTIPGIDFTADIED